MSELVNIGCGAVFHPAWHNYDIVPMSPEVRRLDARCGVPLPDASCDAVYHSHVLEHLTKEEGKDLIRECRRLLRPGGIVRIVVPDLEGIARHYLAALDKAADDGSDGAAEADYDWMVLEMLDQLVRTQSGGEVGPYWTRKEIPNEAFVSGRMGWEFLKVREAHAKREGADAVPARKPWTMDRMRKAARRLRCEAAALAVRVLGGTAMARSLREGVFRNSGEVHRWMYDRFSLGRVLRREGFGSPVTRTYDTSAIEGFDGFELDSWKGKARKPDSLYMEATKR